MPFVEKLTGCRSLAIVGLEKNTGKTVCLNYLLKRLHKLDISTAVTSIGVDGEQVDSVYATAKPEVTLYEGMQFITSRQHYLRRRLVSEILSVDERSTALGVLVTARVLQRGKALLSGAATTALLRQQIDHFEREGVRLTVVDGALSRLSLASPTITDALILATGAAVSPNLNQLISRTRFACRLIDLPEVEKPLRRRLGQVESGLWAVDTDGQPHDLGVASAFLMDTDATRLLSDAHTLFASGAVTARLLRQLTAQPGTEERVLIVRDFTKLFITPEAYADFTRRGGQVRVLRRSRLMAVCLNPTSPQGYTLRSDEACQRLSEALGLPVYDVMRQGQSL